MVEYLHRRRTDLNRQTIDNLKSSLPVLELGASVKPDANVQQYFDFYTIAPECFMVAPSLMVEYLHRRNGTKIIISITEKATRAAEGEDET
jgi:hypothetical protein